MVGSMFSLTLLGLCLILSLIYSLPCTLSELLSLAFKAILPYGFKAPLIANALSAVRHPSGTSVCS